MTRDLVVEEAKSWINTPYHHYAGVKGAGTDCAIILIKIFANVGMIEDFMPPVYPLDWALHRGEEMYLGFVEKYAKKVDVPKAGDVALYTFGRCVSHAGLIIDKDTIIHALMGVGVVYSGIEEGTLKGRLYGFYSLFED